MILKDLKYINYWNYCEDQTWSTVVSEKPSLAKYFSSYFIKNQAESFFQQVLKIPQSRDFCKK